jgi:hypothetical protein
MEISGRRIRRKHPLIRAKKTIRLVVEKTVYQFDWAVMAKKLLALLLRIRLWSKGLL